MYRFWLSLMLLLSCLALFAAGGWATSIFVATTGNDSPPGDGTASHPYATVSYALTHAVAGDTINVRAGTYPDQMGVYNIAGAPGAPITIVSYDGDLQAFYPHSAYVQDSSYITFIGLDFSNSVDPEYHPFKLTDEAAMTTGVIGGAGHHLTVKRCRFRDWDNPGSRQIKNQRVAYVLYEDCEATESGLTTVQGDNNLAWDFYTVYYGTLRRAYIHDYLACAAFTKGGCEYCMLEQNVVAHPKNDMAQGLVGGGESVVPPYGDMVIDGSVFESYYTVIRNNIIQGARLGAVLTKDCAWMYVYNNLFADCGGTDCGVFRQQSCSSYERTTPPALSDHVRVFNNIFLDTAGDMYAAYAIHSGTLTDLVHDYNCYYNAGNPVPAGTLYVDGALVDPATEAHGSFGNPALTNPTGTATSWQGWVDLMRPTASSTAIIDKGSSTAGDAPIPGVLKDIEGNVRPKGTAWDIGPYEYPGAVAVPNANFAADPLWAVPPAVISFTDYTSGGPTAWSWQFGDGTTSTAQNPSHTYTSYGQFTVTLGASNSAGSDPTPCVKTNYITVKPLDANFSATPYWGAAPLAVQFADLSTNSPTAWSWTFGDGSSSTAQNPSHTYNSAGNYNVSLTAWNAGGSDTENRTGAVIACTTVVITPTSWSGNGNMALVSGSLSNLATQDDVCAEFSADTATHNCRLNVYASSGYTPDRIQAITYEARGRSTSATNPQGSVWAKCGTGGYFLDWERMPWGTAFATQTKTYYGMDVPQLMDPTGNVGMYCLFCDYNNGGDYHMQMDLMRWTLYVKVAQSPSPPVANFSGSPTSGNAPLAVSFTDTSANTPTSWNWTFGDSTTSTAQNPSHTFSAAGSYTVSLTATNAQGNNTCTKTNYITVSTGTQTPVANFNGTPTSGNAPLSVSFTDTSTNVPTAWSWTFGDSTTSTAQNPSHTYSSAGTYTVALTATNSAGNNTNTKTGYITVSGSGGSTDFYPTSYNNWSGSTVSGTIANLQADDNVYMVHQCSAGYCYRVEHFFSTGYSPSQVTSMTLSYRIKSNRNDSPVVHVYAYTIDAAQHGVVLANQYPTTTESTISWTTSNVANYMAADGTVDIDLCGTTLVPNTSFQLSYDQVKLTLQLASPPAPVANFSGTPTSGNAPLSVSFTDTSTNTPTAWSWTFGDGNTSTVHNPTHSYAAGTFTVGLTATNASGSDSETKTDYIDVAGNGPAVFYPSSYNNWPGTTLVSGSVTNLQADDNAYMVHASTSGGNFRVEHFFSTGYAPSQVSQMTVEYHLKSSRDDTPQVNVYEMEPGAGDQHGVVLGYQPLTTTESVITWSTSNIAYYFPADGNVDIDICGCPQVASTAYQISFDQVKLTLGLVGGPFVPVADFTAMPTSGAAPLGVTFSDTSTNNPTSWSWTFGDSSTSTAQNPLHTYNSAGTYTVALTATNAAGSNTNTKNNFITVGNAPVASFSGTPTSGAAPLSVTFTDSSTNSPTAWSWTFGDSNSSTVQNPSHSYAAAGSYTVALTATNAYGNNTNTKNNYITAGAAPVANFSGTPTSGAAPLSVTFTDSSTNTPTAWSWNFGDSTTSTAQNPSHTYSAAGTFTVALTATNAYGNNTNTKSNYITATSSSPTFVAAGTVIAGTGTVTPAMPAGIATNDILLLFVETANQASSISNQNGGTWAQVTNSPQSVGTAGGSNGTRLTVFWSRYNGTQGAPTVADSGDHQIGRIIAIRGATTSGNPWDITFGGTESTVDTSASIPGGATTVNNTLIVLAFTTSLPDATGTSNFSGWYNNNFTSTERTDNTQNAGNGGGLGTCTAPKASAGAYGNTDATCATASTKAMISIAIKP